MNIVNIQTFLHIVRCGSISEAAKSLFVSQPTVSSRLKQLEDELGFKLIHREKGERQARITQKGQAFISLAESWLDLQSRTMAFSKMESKKILNVVAPSSMNLHVLHHVFKKVIKKNTSIQPQMMAMPSPMVYSSVGSREADLGFAYRINQYGNTVAIPIYEEKNILLCSSLDEWPERAIHPGELDPCKEIAVASWTGEARRWHNSWWDPFVAPYVKVDNTSSIANFLEPGNTWAICPISIAKSFVESGFMVTIRDLNPSPINRICYQVMNREQNKFDLTSVSNFMDEMYAYIDETPWIQRIKE